jgi:hypothetical protein
MYTSMSKLHATIIQHYKYHSNRYLLDMYCLSVCLRTHTAKELSTATKFASDLTLLLNSSMQSNDFNHSVAQEVCRCVQRK